MRTRAKHQIDEARCRSDQHKLSRREIVMSNETNVTSKLSKDELIKLVEAQQQQLLDLRLRISSGARTTLATWRTHSATSIIRSLALMGANPARINGALVKMNIVASPATIIQQRRQALKEAKAGAPLSTEDETALKAILAQV
jgi:hypothetical protein